MSILNKPQKKTNFAIVIINKYTRTIIVQTDPKLADKHLYNFGTVTNYNLDRYALDVDARFDFDEVANYIKSAEKMERIQNV